MFAYGAAPMPVARTGRHRHRTRQHLGRGRQAPGPRRGRHRRRGRSDRDRDPRRRDRRPGARRRRPDQPGRARPDGGQRAGHHIDRAGRRGRRRAGAAGRRDQARRARTRGAVRRAVGHRPGRRHRRRAAGAATTYAAEHLEIQTADARAVADRVRNAGAVFVGAYSPVSLGDYCAGSNHVLPTGGCARHTGGLTVADVHSRACRSSSTSRDALAERRRARGRRWPRPRTCRRTARRSPRGRHGPMTGSDALPIRDDLRGAHALRRAAARRRRSG